MKRSPLLLFVLTLGVLSFPKVVNAQINDWQKGITLRLNNQTVTDVDYSLNWLKKTNANYVVITPGYITDNEYSSNVDRKPGTPSDAILIYTINKAHSLGFKVMLKPHLDLKTGIWRANLDPTDKDTFFTNYNSMIIHNADIAKQTNVEMFSIGCELVLLSTNSNNENYWNNIISNVRNIYSGKITYSANAGTGSVDETKLPFWEKLDYLGLDMYMSLSDTNTPTLDSLMSSWKRIDTEYVAPFKQKYPTKPLIFTEMGFRSMDGASTMPWDYQVNKAVDLNEQYLMYQSFFNYWNNVDYFKGVNIWDWQIKQNAGGSADNDYTPQNKPAEGLITKMFTSGMAVVSPTPSVTPTITNVPTVSPTIIPSVLPTILSPIPTVSNTTILNLLPSTYKIDTLELNKLVYTDRSYVLKDIPSELLKSLFIRTRNADKNIINSNYLSFSLNQDSYIYIAVDYRNKQLPSWLSSFSKTSLNIKSTDTTYNIYVKKYIKGLVSIGGNVANSGQQNISNYFVIISNVSLAAVPSIAPTPVSLIVSPTTAPLITPTVFYEGENYINKEINIVEPTINSNLSGEKKIKIQISDLDLTLYKAYVDINGIEYEMTDSIDNLYKQLKFDYGLLDLQNRGYTLTFIAKDLKGNIFAIKTLTLPF